MKKIWILWGLICLALAGYFVNQMFIQAHKTDFLIGEASYGHYQIEMACTACHTEPFGGEEILQNACVACHQTELDAAHDSHPKKKFTDPRNADRLEVVDARHCVSCHTEHQHEQTRAMGVSLPDDYCYHCHQDIAEERESHQDLAFDSCADAGCHNYHDNRALYENFLLQHAAEPWLKVLDEVVLSSSMPSYYHHSKNADFSDVSAQQSVNLDSEAKIAVAAVFAEDIHAEAGLSCASCHLQDADEWLAKPASSQCATCHSQETEGFLASKHGMRLAQDLPAMNTDMSRSMAFHTAAQQECSACHAPHQYQQMSAIESCLSCHDDQHSKSFIASPHAKQSDIEFSCATCHMPHKQIMIDGQAFSMVEHNQNANLRPNEKMIREVCLDCHGLGFSIDALADQLLINNNFNGQPSMHVPSIDWALERDSR